MQQSLIPRDGLCQAIETRLDEAAVTVLLGARQTGKTTLARLFAEGRADVHYFDLERAADRRSLSTPELALEPLRGTIVIDEVQRLPGLFEVLRPLADRPNARARFLLLGSASPDLVKGVSETLAGRALFLRIPGFSLWEIGVADQAALWLRGGLPRAYLARSDEASQRWRESFIDSFLERDIPRLGIRVPAETLRRFWSMLCHYHGQIWNASEMARSLGTSEKTARHYLDILNGVYMMRVLTPWHENVGKRQVKSPKVYLRDTGLLHTLLGLESMSDVRAHPKYGASWEGFALEQTLIAHGERNAFFWATHRGAELDLMLVRKGRRYGFEFKCQDAPRMTRSLHVALNDLGLQAVRVVYPGKDRYRLHEKVECVPLRDAGAPLHSK